MKIDINGLFGKNYFYSGYLLLVNIVVFLLLAIFNSRLLPPLIPLWYGMPFGVLQIADRQLIFVPTLISLLFFIVNFLLSTTLIKDQFLIKTLMGACLISFVLALYITIRIIALVGI